MRIAFIIVSFLLINGYSYAQKKHKRIYVDENDQEISRSELLNKWRDKNLLLSRWDYIKNNTRYVTLKKDLYQTAHFNYQHIKSRLEFLTKNKVDNNTIILLEYYYKDDLCSSKRDNTWTKIEISDRKRFLSPILRTLKGQDITFIVLFEEDIILNNNPKLKKEYFYTDKDNYFRNKLFTNPTLCGSFALIKPNGETLIRNGEYRADWMAEHLKKENWSIFFGSTKE
ncbi:hypothetical protein [Mangrovimonas spongiae]|uniref:Uncharacterized protein n=1 Tax=Mangrovimonas spongiae TaxID=2494697 RepID=A0A428K6L1_9FLAO|nr:hypothetical protein [Mangrovimonas spongiae]RSK41949.1 hypothetical protein EJA19_03455 [Mangrovimonas spongiae]